MVQKVSVNVSGAELQRVVEYIKAMRDEPSDDDAPLVAPTINWQEVADCCDDDDVAVPVLGEPTPPML